jgi:hypothetical protein
MRIFLRIIGSELAIAVHRGASRKENKQKFFARCFNMIRPIARQNRIPLLDSALFFAAWTRAHAGFAELRPPRSRSLNTPLNTPQMTVSPRRDAIFAAPRAARCVRSCANMQTT